jgi:hypothetical protein
MMAVRNARNAQFKPSRFWRRDGGEAAARVLLSAERISASVQYSPNGAVTLIIDAGAKIIKLDPEQVRALRMAREILGLDDFLSLASIASARLGEFGRADGFEECLALFEERLREEERRGQTGADRHRAETKPLMSW